MKVLIVEDEPKVATFIKKGLEEHFFTVEQAFEGNTALHLMMTYTYDVIILDVNLPQINGLDLCKKIRANNIHTPVLILTAMGTTEDKLLGFEVGADDYLIKPFEFRELLARLKALYKRSNDHQQPSNILKVADLELDLNQKIAIRQSKKIDLTAKEFALLEYFIRHKGKVLPRIEIAEKVWEINFDTGTNVIDVYVNFLRKKIDKDFEKKLINTVVGMGYMLKE